MLDNSISEAMICKKMKQLEEEKTKIDIDNTFIKHISMYL